MSEISGLKSQRSSKVTPREACILIESDKSKHTGHVGGESTLILAVNVVGGWGGVGWGRRRWVEGFHYTNDSPPPPPPASPSICLHLRLRFFFLLLFLALIQSTSIYCDGLDTAAQPPPLCPPSIHLCCGSALVTAPWPGLRRLGRH